MIKTTIRPNKKGVFPTAPSGELFFLALGNGSQFLTVVAESPDGLFVAIERHGAYSFGAVNSWEYVRQKLGGRLAIPDAQAITDFIRDQLHEVDEVDGRPTLRFGHYNEKLCSND